jgi:hypothetical protein
LKQNLVYPVILVDFFKGVKCYKKSISDYVGTVKGQVDCGELQLSVCSKKMLDYSIKRAVL